MQEMTYKKKLEISQLMPIIIGIPNGFYSVVMSRLYPIEDAMAMFYQVLVQWKITIFHATFIMVPWMATGTMTGTEFLVKVEKRTYLPRFI